MRQAVLSCLVCAVIPAAALAQPDDAEAPGRAPLVGRPADVPFTEASASFATVGPGELRAPFEVTATATPARLPAGASLRYAVTIRALGRVHHPPSRIDLRLIPAFARAFHIEDLTEGGREQTGPASWRWEARLRPRDTQVREVPGLPFAYYNPDLRPPERGFQVLWTDPLPIEVEAPEPYRAPAIAPPSALLLAKGPAVLREQRPWPVPGPWALSLAWAVPPVMCAGWFVIWRWRYPDAARQARRRRSRAARRALRALNGAERSDVRQRGDRVAGAVAGYLRERFDLAAAEPTPEEGRAALLAGRLTGDLPARGADLLAACDAARFAPAEPGDGLVDTARAFILAVEEQACTPSR